MKEFADLYKKYCQEIQKTSGVVSEKFAEISEKLKSEIKAGELPGEFNSLFRLWLKTIQQVFGQFDFLYHQAEKFQKQTTLLQEEKRRLEVLFTSGISFSSETEKTRLMNIAIETVVKELDADEGFIVLVDEKYEIESLYSKNMEPEQHGDAMNLSMSVINKTLVKAEPTQSDNYEKFLEDSKKGSQVRLGIKSTLCVPLLSKSRVIGAVYLDRRNIEKHFNEVDLVFLISFARVIVNSIEISQEISLLENKLVRESQLKFEDLRQEFKCDNIIGRSQSLFKVLQVASKISPTNAPVILCGENGTGKELFAHAIHENSRRASGPFFTINCSAIPEDLLESELFGYEPGAFTGATKSKPGKFELADKGTLFLDEIGELNFGLQAKLLRVLQEQEFERLGSVELIKINVRILAATNTNLKQLITEGKFREDLYYRLKVIEIEMPPLRERKEDIPELVNHFLAMHAQEGKILDISPEALELLENYDWPGNIRELENVVLRGIVLSKGATVQIADLPPELVEGEIVVPRIPPGQVLCDAEIEFRRRYILRTLSQANSNAEAARILGVNRTHFYRMLAQLGIKNNEK